MNAMQFMAPTNGASSNQKKSSAIGSWLRSCRLALDWKQSELARQMGTTQATVSRWEKGASMNLEDVEAAYTLFKSKGLNPPAPPVIRETATQPRAAVKGYIEDGAAVRFETGEPETIELPAGFAAQPLAAYRVETDSLLPIGRGWMIFTADQRSGVSREAHDKLCVIGTPSHGVVLGYLRPMPGGRFYVERPNAPGFAAERVDWAERVQHIRPA